MANYGKLLQITLLIIYYVLVSAMYFTTICTVVRHVPTRMLFSLLSYVEFGTPMQELFQHSGLNQTGLEASKLEPAICQITKTKIKRPKTPKVIHLKILSHGSTARSFKTRNPIRKPAIAPKPWAALDVVVPYPFH